MRIPITISRLVSIREYQALDDILRTTTVGPDSSKIIFKDGSEWVYPQWDLFTLEQILGYIFWRVSTIEMDANARVTREMNNAFADTYFAALAFHTQVYDLEVIADCIKEEVRLDPRLEYRGWKELIEKGKL